MGEIQDLDLGLHPRVCDCVYFILKLFSLICLKSVSDFFTIISFAMDCRDLKGIRTLQCFHCLISNRFFIHIKISGY